MFDWNAELELANKRFIERKIAMGARVFEALPYLELAQACFKSAKGMPEGEAAATVRTHAAAFYTKAIAQKKLRPTDSEVECKHRALAAPRSSAGPAVRT
jgi:hypothetical protein